MKIRYDVLYSEKPQLLNYISKWYQRTKDLQIVKQGLDGLSDLTEYIPHFHKKNIVS